MKTRTSRDKERGATLVEAAISYSLLFLALFAVVEFGLAFKDWLSVSQATREGARAGATFGTDPSADIKILDGVEDALLPQGWADGDQVTIFKANEGSPSQVYTYDTNFDCSDPDDIYADDDCCNWFPCPDSHRDNYAVPAWDPAIRDDTAPNTDRVGVSIQMTHEWITGFIGTGTLDVSSTTDFAIEPQLFNISGT